MKQKTLKDSECLSWGDMTEKEKSDFLLNLPHNSKRNGSK